MSENKTDQQAYLEELDGASSDHGIDEPGPQEHKKPEDTPEDPNKPKDMPGDEPPADEPLKPELYEKYTKGRFKTPEEIDAHFTEYEGIKTKYSALEAENAELKKVSNANPYEEDEDLYRILQLSKQLNTKDYAMVGKINPDVLKSMGHLDVLKFKSILDDPDYRGKEGILDRSLSKKYKVEKPADYEDLTPEEKKEIDLEVEENEFMLKKDADKVRKELTDLYNKVEIPKKKTLEDIKADSDKRIEKLKTNWSAPLKEEVFPALAKFSFKEGDEDIEITIPESLKEAKDKVLSQVIDVIYANDLEAKPEVIKDLKERAINAFFAENREAIIAEVSKSVAERVRKMNDEQWAKSVYNSSAMKNVGKKDQGPAVKTDQEKYMADAGL